MMGVCGATSSTLEQERALGGSLNRKPHTQTQGYACTSLNLASALSADPDHLTPDLVDRLLAHVALLVSDEHATVASLAPACAASVLLQPCTLHPTPCNLHPKPYLHPAPCTLHPKP